MRAAPDPIHMYDIARFQIAQVRLERGQIGWTACIGHYVTTSEQCTDVYMEAADYCNGISLLTAIAALFGAIRKAKKQHRECSATIAQRQAKGWAWK